MDCIGIVGAGVMGQGIAHCLAEKGKTVYIYDIDNKKTDGLADKIVKSIKTNRMFLNTEFEGMDAIRNRIKIYEKMEFFEEPDIIIECISEVMEIKKEAFVLLDKIAKQSCIFFSNASCISITQLASFTQRPEQVIGVHFMNPAYLIHTVEVIKGLLTSMETVNATNQFIESIGKKSILVNDYPGYVSNRISHLMMNEAAFIVQDQVASAEAVDRIFKECYGHKMGPLETADLIGIDVVVNSLDILYKSYQDSKFRCCPLLSRMVYANLLGRKTGEGFYKYER